MRKAEFEPNGIVPVTGQTCTAGDGTSSPHTPGDILIQAIADAVATKLYRTGLACQQRLMDVHDAARYLGMTANAIREKASARELPCVRVDGKLRFDRLELDRWIDRAPRQGF